MANKEPFLRYPKPVSSFLILDVDGFSFCLDDKAPSPAYAIFMEVETNRLKESISDMPKVWESDSTSRSLSQRADYICNLRPSFLSELNAESWLDTTGMSIPTQTDQKHNTCPTRPFVNGTDIRWM